MDIFSISQSSGFGPGASLNSLSYSLGNVAMDRLAAPNPGLPTASPLLAQQMASDRIMQQNMLCLLQMLTGLLSNGQQGTANAGQQTSTSTTPVSDSGSQSAPVSQGQQGAASNIDQAAVKSTKKATGTGYYPDNSAMEGGYNDRQGKKLNTLQDFLAGKADYVSVAMDKNEHIPYGAKLRIPELEKKYGRPIEFRVVDTGGAFTGKGTSRIDICTASKKDSLDPTINGPLTLQFV